MARCAKVMTEDSRQGEDRRSRIKSIIEFSDKIKKEGDMFIMAEIIDRIDDISDLSYLLNKLKGADDNTKEDVKKKLIAKFGKCLYAVKKMENDNYEVKKLIDFFSDILKYQVDFIKINYGVDIKEKDIKNEVEDCCKLEN